MQFKVLSSVSKKVTSFTSFTPSGGIRPDVRPVIVVLVIRVTAVMVRVAVVREGAAICRFALPQLL